MMTTLMLNTISAASINGLEIAKNSLLNGNFYSGVSFFNQDEMGTVSNIRSEALIHNSYETSYSWLEPEWKTINDIYNKLSFNELLFDNSEENQKTSEESGIQFRDKVIQLQKELGNEIFNQLNNDQLMLLVNTAGFFDFGPLNIKKVYKYIEEY